MFTRILATIGAFTLLRGFFSYAAQEFIDNIVLLTGKPSLSFENAAQQRLTIHLPLSITNLNSFAIDFDSLQGEAYLGERLLDANGDVLPNGGLKLTDVLVINPTPIGAGQTAVLNVVFDVNISSTLQQIVQQVQGGFVPITTNIYFYGWVNMFGTNSTGGVKVPIQFPISLIP